MVTYFINSKLKKTHVFFLHFDLYFYLLRKEPPSGRVVALLVEEFETFMKQRPGFVEDSGSEVRKKICPRIYSCCIQQ